MEVAKRTSLGQVPILTQVLAGPLASSVQTEQPSGPAVNDESEDGDVDERSRGDRIQYRAFNAFPGTEAEPSRGYCLSCQLCLDVYFRFVCYEATLRDSCENND